MMSVKLLKGHVITMRLDKYLAESSVGTRRQVRIEIKEGQVTVNGQVEIEPARELFDEDVVAYKGQMINHPGKCYVMFHKPAGCITARKDEIHKTVMDYFDDSYAKSLFPVGRLDKDTEGLLLLTNDGEFDYRLMNPTNHVSKKYYFWVLGTITEESHKKLEQGLSISELEEITKPAKVKIIKSGTYDEYQEELRGIDAKNMKENNYIQTVTAGYITVTEGRKHQVKRMLKAVGCYVVYLKRVQIGNLELDNTLAPGQYRELTKEEVEAFL